MKFRTNVWESVAGQPMTALSMTTVTHLKPYETAPAIARMWT